MICNLAIAMNPRHCLVFFATLLLLPLGHAQNSCDSVFVKYELSKLYDSTAKVIGIEWNVNLNEVNMKLIDEVVNQGRAITPLDRQNFNENILSYLKYYDLVQKREIEALLGRKISQYEAISARFARGIGRTEKGVREDLQAFSGNYTKDQIARKDRLLDLAGFNLEERVALLGNKMVDDVLTKYAAENLMLDQMITPEKSPQRAARMNEEVIAQMNILSKSLNPHSKKIQALNTKEARDLYEAVTRHPVARLLKIKKYDKNPDEHIGFCFGRAMAAHIEALSRGIEKDSIRKVFAVGKMKALVGDIHWQFHVATAVKNSDGGWWVIDPFFGKATTIESWYQKMSKQDSSGTLRIYTTEAARFSADDTSRYQKAHLMMDYYNGYFRDLMDYYAQKSKKTLPPKDLKTSIFDWTLSIINLGI